MSGSPRGLQVRRCDAHLSDTCSVVTDDVERDHWPRKYINRRLMWAICLECMPLITSLHEFSQRVERGQW